MHDTVKEIYEGILNGDQALVQEQVQAALAQDLPARTILQEGLIAAMDRVGELFERSEFYVPEMLISARAMKAGLEILRPELMEDEVETVGHVVIGTVEGDLHDIGKKLVAIMLEGAGFQVTDLGVDISPDGFIEAVKDQPVDILALSALLTTTMTSMEATVTAFQEAGLRDSVRIIVGGAPVTEDFAREIGADGYAPDASVAVKLSKNLLNGAV
jgi:5-methyltetrahydrofolate--homocysteine methyltransferase